VLAHKFFRALSLALDTTCLNVLKPINKDVEVTMIRNNQKGQVLVTAALSLVVLLGISGLAVDMGAMRYQKRLQQTAADGAAIAAASNLNQPSGGVLTGAQNASASNGFTDNTGGGACTTPPTNLAVGSVTVTVCNGPLVGPHIADVNYVEAYVSVGQPTYFMKIFGVNSQTITARAVATNTGGGGAVGGGCIYTLGTPNKKLAGVATGGSAIINAPTCGIVDNGNFVANGGANLSVVAGSIGVGGTYTGPGCGGTSGVCPPPVISMPYSGDPFANKYPTTSTVLSDAGASKGDVKITAGTCAGSACAANVSCTATSCVIHPGNYNDICIDNNQTVDFAAGVYVINGSSTCSNKVEFVINAGSTVCNSTNLDCSGMIGSANAGVTFYLTGNASANVSGTATVQLVAPNSGTYEGLLFYQDPSDTVGATLSGNTTSLYQGAIYMPDAQLTFGGNTTFNNGAAYTVLVVDELQVSGNPDVNLKSNYSGLANGGGPLAGITKWATLVE
jgi:Flp pilus assembly protein TadG